MNKFVFADFETFSLADLTEVGLDNYAKDPSTGVSMMAYAVDEGEIKVWLPHIDPNIPKEILDAVSDPDSLIVAWHAPFEKAIFKYVLKLDIPISKFRDPIVLSHNISLPGSLEKVGAILKMTEQKDPRGDELKAMFCQPVSRGGEMTLFGISPPLFRDHNSHPREFAEYQKYCIQDVRSMRDIWYRLLKVPFPELDWQGWILDQKINEFGMPGNRARAEKMLRIANRFVEEKKEQLKKMTGLENPNSDPQMKEWLSTRGYPWGSLNAKYVQMELDNPESKLTPETKEILVIRKDARRSSYKKLETFLATLSSDDRLRYQFRYMGAPRTGRWAGGSEEGKSFQAQNMSRGEKAVKKNLTRALELVDAEDYDGILREFTNIADKKKSVTPVSLVITLLRSLFEAGPGKKLIVADKSAVEIRVLGWMAGCWKMLETFTHAPEDGGDTYLDFGTYLYGKNYAEMWASYKAGNEEERQNSKAPKLGCFGADTLVLTSRGWVSIKNVHRSDKVFDGVDWVSHDGVVDQGPRFVVNLKGIWVTPDHKFLSADQWRNAWDLNQSTLFAKQATDSALGLLSNLRGKMEKSVTSAFVKGVGTRKPLTEETWNLEEQSPASSVQTKEYWKRRDRSILTFPNTLGTLSTDWLTDTMPCYLAAEELDQNPADMQDEGFVVGLPIFTNSCRMSSLFPVLTIQNSNWIGKIMTAITRKETYVSYLRKLTTAIKKTYVGFSTAVCGTARWNSGSNTLPDIEVNGRLKEKYEKGLLQNKSSQTKPDVEVPTFDIANSGPRHQFMILTDIGPMIAHNCGYGLSGGELYENENGDMVWGGLMGYARNVVGVEMPKELAHKAVEVYRQIYPEVVQLWTDLEEAFKQVLNRGGVVKVGEVTWDKKQRKWVKHPNSLGCVLTFTRHKIENGGWMIRMELPSGRGLHYLNATIEEEIKTSRKTGRPFTVYTIYYDGIEHSATQDASGKTVKKQHKWGRVKTSGMKLTENGDQAISRDLFLNDAMEADKMGFSIFGLFHDELGCEEDDDVYGLTVDDLTACMSVVPEWANGLILAAEGWSGQVYRK